MLGRHACLLSYLFRYAHPWYHESPQDHPIQKPQDCKEHYFAFGITLYSPLPTGEDHCFVSAKPTHLQTEHLPSGAYLQCCGWLTAFWHYIQSSRSWFFEGSLDNGLIYPP
ncbi:hypothetical protein EDC04DRAFT_2748173 [Pisolithus marmoratus]|nr:hypothetical protein EDC04DRAFT_2748173 [Pisolithus marmoratus]